MAQVEGLIGEEGNAFAFTGDVEEDLLSITAVHPMRAEAVSDLLKRAGADWTLLRGLLAQGQLIRVEYGGTEFYLRKFRTDLRFATGFPFGPREGHHIDLGELEKSKREYYRKMGWGPSRRSKAGPLGGVGDRLGGGPVG